VRKHKELVAIIIAAIMLAITIVTAFSAFTERMAVVEVQLVTIQRDIAELSISVNHREEAIRDLRELIAELDSRLAQLETKVRNLEWRIDHATG